MTAAATRLALFVGAGGSLTPVEAAKAAAETAAYPVLILDAAEAAESPALRQIAESVAETVLVDTRDLDAVCAAVAATGAHAAATFVDGYCPAVDEVNARVFGKSAPAGRWGKHVQRRMLAEAGVCRVTNALVRSWDEAAQVARRLGFPLVLKPVNGVASRDVWLLSCAEDLLAVQRDLGTRVESGFVLETYVPGPARSRGSHRADYLSAELFVTGEGAQGFLTDRPPLVRPCRESGIIGPSSVDPDTERAVTAKALAAHRALGLGPGTFHIEVKLTDTDPEVLEVNGRLGGYVRRLVQLGTGVDVAPAAVLAALDRPHPLELTWRSQVAAVFLQAPVEAAVIAAAPRRKEIARLPGVLAVDHVAPAGTGLDWRRGTGAAAAKVWIEAEDDAALRERMIECALRLADAFDFRDPAARRVRDLDWLARLTEPAPEHAARRWNPTKDGTHD